MQGHCPLGCTWVFARQVGGATPYKPKEQEEGTGPPDGNREMVQQHLRISGQEGSKPLLQLGRQRQARDGKDVLVSLEIRPTLQRDGGNVRWYRLRWDAVMAG